MFKTQFLKNLDMIVEARLEAGKSLSLVPKMVGLSLFGDIDWETGFDIETGAFQQAFTPSRYDAAWKKVGAATEDGVTRECLSNPEVMKEHGDGKDTDEPYKAIQTANELAIHALMVAGYDGHWLQSTLKKKEVDESISVANTAARQERQAIAHGHGGRFHASNGMQITDNDIFIAFEMKDHKKAKAEAKKEKKCWLQQQTNEEKALKILAVEGGRPE
jgi:hypothetical protein